MAKKKIGAERLDDMSQLRMLGQPDDGGDEISPPSESPPLLHEDEEDTREDVQARRKERHSRVGKDARKSVRASMEKEATEGAKKETTKDLRKGQTKKDEWDATEQGPFRTACYKILTWKGFDYTMGVIIICNGFTIGYEAQTKASIPMVCDALCNCSSDLPVVCHVVPEWMDAINYAFTAPYFLELALRFIVYGPRVLIHSGWVRLDLVLVVSAIAEITFAQFQVKSSVFESVELMRMLRLVRLARAVRLLSLFKTMWMLVQGLMHSVNTLCWTCFLTMILLYIFAIVGMELIKVDLDLPLDHPYNIAANDNFRDLADACMVLLQFFSWDSIGGIYRPIIRQHKHLFFYFMAVLLVMSIALMNLVTAIMVEGSLEQGNEDRETRKAWEAAKKLKQMEELKVMFLELDEDGSGELSMDEIDSAPAHMRDQLIEIAGTDDIRALFEMLDYDGGGTVGTEEFCEGVIKATSSEKPMELNRLVKQCSDILVNSRQTVALLRGEELEGEDDGGDGDNDDPAPKPRGNRRRSESGCSKDSSGGSNASPEIEHFAASIETRVSEIERAVADMKGDVQDILSCVMEMTTSSKPLTGMKKAVAVCRGPVHSTTWEP